MTNTEAFIKREDGKLVEVMPDSESSLEKGYAYLHGDYVYIYRGKKKDIKDVKLKPGSVYLVDGERVWVEPSDELKDLYHKSRIKMYDTELIFEAIREQALKEPPPALLEVSKNAFMPPIFPDDDILKKIIKEVLANKRIEIRCSKEYRNNYDITNIKAGIMKATPLSIKYFSKWIELLQMEVEIVCKYTDCNGEEKILRKEF